MGKRKNILTKKENMPDFIRRQYENAKTMATLAQSKIQGMKRVPHPSLPKTWIYVQA